MRPHPARMYFPPESADRPTTPSHHLELPASFSQLQQACHLYRGLVAGMEWIGNLLRSYRSKEVSTAAGPCTEKGKERQGDK